MAEYHVACGAFGIYAGTLNSKNKRLWRDKSDVTLEALKAVAQFLLDTHAHMSFDYEDGKRYQLCVQQEIPEAPKEEN